MKIAIISDIHDRRDHLAAALDLAGDCEALFVLGDLCSPFIMRDIAARFPGDIHIVFGNNDGDLYRLTEAARAGEGEGRTIHLHAQLGEVELEGKKFAIHHYDDIGRAIAASDRYDVVCFGHNHRPEIALHGSTVVINPGELAAVISDKATFAFYDTDTNEAMLTEVGK